jgi:hypothetical protein
MPFRISHALIAECMSTKVKKKMEKANKHRDRLDRGETCRKRDSIFVVIKGQNACYVIGLGCAGRVVDRQAFSGGRIVYADA